MGGNSSKSPPNGGLRVHRVYPNGPGDIAGIEPFFDYVLDADGYTYTDDSDETLNLFTKYVNDHENQQICLNVYNARKKNIREVFIVPQKWDGIGLLGLTLKFGLFTCLDQGAHVIHIYDKSPAQKAGLMPITDYLLGTNLQLFFDLDCVRIHVANQVDKEIILIVYNSVTETVRRTVIIPKENWGGKGTLGCDLARGYIHRIPYVKSLFTYPTIDSYPTFDSNLSKEVVDTIDLSIGNVDNYYNSSNNTTIRQDIMLSERTEVSSERNQDTDIHMEMNKDNNKDEMDLDNNNENNENNNEDNTQNVNNNDNMDSNDNTNTQYVNKDNNNNSNLGECNNMDNKDEDNTQNVNNIDNEFNSDYNELDLNNSYQPPSMLNLEFSNYNDSNNSNLGNNNNSNQDLNSFSNNNNNKDNLDIQDNTNNFNNIENIVNPMYNNDKLFTQDSDNV